MTEDTVTEAELPLEASGARLLRAREAAGLSRAQIAATTKIPERHLIAIEAGNLAALPARTYAVGFSRTYARAVGLDENAIAADVRAELDETQGETQRRTVPAFEPGDPARIPGARLAWLAAAAGLLAVVVLGFLFVPAMFAPGGELPSVLPDETPSAASSASAAPASVAAAGPVVLTATQPKVWIKVVDGSGNQLFQKELAQGETYTVPADQADVRLSTARPDALAITIGGQGVAPLSPVQQLVRDVPITAAALQSRGSAQASPAQPPQPQSAAPAAPARTDRGGARRGANLRPQVSNLPAAAPRGEPAPPAAAAPAPVAAPQDAAPPPAADR